MRGETWLAVRSQRPVVDGVTQGTVKENSKRRQERKQPRLEPQGTPWAEAGQRVAGEERGKSKAVQVKEQSRGETKKPGAQTRITQTIQQPPTPASGRRRCPGGVADRGGTVSRPGPDSLAKETYVPWLRTNTRPKPTDPTPSQKMRVSEERPRRACVGDTRSGCEGSRQAIRRPKGGTLGDLG